MKNAIKWFFICIVICFVTTVLISFIPITEIRIGLNQTIGFIAGAYCMTEYLNEV